MAIFLRHSYNIPPTRWGSVADVQYAIQENSEKIFRVETATNIVVMPFFWGLPCYNYSIYGNRGINSGGLYKDRSLVFGASDYIDFGDKSIFYLTEYSWSIVMKGNNAPGTSAITTPIYNGAGQQFQFVWDHTSPTFKQSAVHKSSETWHEAQIASTVYANTWHKIVGTYSNVELKIYLDGNHEDTEAVNPPNKTAGSFFLNAPTGIGSQINEFRLSSVAYTPDQISLFSDLPYGLYQKVSRPFYLLPIAAPTGNALWYYNMLKRRNA